MIWAGGTQNIIQVFHIACNQNLLLLLHFKFILNEKEAVANKGLVGLKYQI